MRQPGGFETIADSRNGKDYRRRVRDSETVSMWQSLAYGPNYKAAYCMAVCPAGEDVITVNGSGHDANGGIATRARNILGKNPDGFGGIGLRQGEAGQGDGGRGCLQQVASAFRPCAA